MNFYIKVEIHFYRYRKFHGLSPLVNSRHSTACRLPFDNQQVRTLTQFGISLTTSYQRNKIDVVREVVKRWYNKNVYFDYFDTKENRNWTKECTISKSNLEVNMLYGNHCSQKLTWQLMDNRSFAWSRCHRYKFQDKCFTGKVWFSECAWFLRELFGKSIPNLKVRLRKCLKGNYLFIPVLRHFQNKLKKINSVWIRYLKKERIQLINCGTLKFGINCSVDYVNANWLLFV